MLTPDEVEACVLGAQLVARQGDPALARAAEDLVAKIRTVAPEHLRVLALEPATRVAPNWKMVPDRLDMAADLTTHSRLGCQAIIKGDVVCELPS